MSQETSLEYQMRMSVAHETMAAIHTAQAAIYKFWKFEKSGKWDNQGMVDKTTIMAYDALTEASDQIRMGIGVAHYG